MIKLGIIGLGHMGGYHASVSNNLSTVQLVGIADPSEKNREKIKGATVLKSESYTDWIDAVDAVIIAVPTGMHHAIAADCIKRGKHVLLEKPLTNNLVDAQDLVALAQQHNTTLHVGHIERFNGAIQELKKIIHEPLLIECHRMGPFVSRVAGDSVVLDLMIHDIDLVLSIVDSPVVSVAAQGTKVHSASCDIAHAQIKFANGTVASIVSSRASQVKKRSMAVHQKNEYLHLDFTTQDISIHRHASSSVQVSNDQVKYRQEGTVEHLFVFKDNPLKLEIEHFLKSVASGDNKVNPSQDLKALEITFEIERLLGLRG